MAGKSAWGWGCRDDRRGSRRKGPSHWLVVQRWQFLHLAFFPIQELCEDGENLWGSDSLPSRIATMKSPQRLEASKWAKSCQKWQGSQTMRTRSLSWKHNLYLVAFGNSGQKWRKMGLAAHRRRSHPWENGDLCHLLFLYFFSIHNCSSPIFGSGCLSIIGNAKHQLVIKKIFQKKKQNQFLKWKNSWNCGCSRNYFQK